MNIAPSTEIIPVVRSTEIIKTTMLLLALLPPNFEIITVEETNIGSVKHLLFIEFVLEIKYC